MDVVVWNLDARYRPELEVEIVIDDEEAELEVERQMIAARERMIEDLFADAWFLADGV